MTLLFDIGATHMRLALATDDGIGPMTRVHTPPDPEEGIALLLAEAQKLGALDRMIGGFAGTHGDDGSIGVAPNLPAWNGFPFVERVEIPVELHNDAELNGLGEAIYGAGKGKRTVAYMGVGTGVGTCLVVDGAYVATSSEGALRERVVELADNTHLEAHIGGRALTEEFGMPPPELPAGTVAKRLPYLVEGVRNMLEAWTPDIVVLGGSLMNDVTGFAIADVRAALDTTVPIERGTLGDASALWGGRALI